MPTHARVTAVPSGNYTTGSTDNRDKRLNVVGIEGSV